MGKYEVRLKVKAYRSARAASLVIAAVRGAAFGAGVAMHDGRRGKESRDN
jgi:hypothetical protein